MAPTGALVAAALQARIRASSHELTVVYPPMRIPAAVGSGTPVSPLTGQPATPALRPAATTPVKDPVTMPCLWQELQAIGDVRRNAIMPTNYGWVADADVYARVCANDALDGVVFEGVDYVEHRGKRYKLLSVSPAGPAFGEAHSYYVWLKGALKN